MMLWRPARNTASPSPSCTKLHARVQSELPSSVGVHCRSTAIHLPPSHLRTHHIGKPSRHVSINHAASSTEGTVKLEEALRQAAEALIQTSEKYQAALESSAETDRAIDAEWKALTHSHPVGVGDSPTEMPSVRVFCAKALKEFQGGSPVSPALHETTLTHPLNLPTYKAHLHQCSLLVMHLR